MSIFILLMPPLPDERENDLVGARYVATRFGCSIRSVERGACNTGNIPRISNYPLRFRRADVDRELERIIEASRPKRNRPVSLIDRSGERTRRRRRSRPAA